MSPAPVVSAAASTPAVLVAAPASGSGKTFTTAAWARSLVRRGRRVRVFKTGPDFIDPRILERASRAPVGTLDLWMVGEDACRRKLEAARAEADVILVEGVMGLFDGTPSSATLALRLGLPVFLVIDAAAMAETFGALVEGLVRYEPALSVAGIIANRVGGPGHAALLRKAVRVPHLWRGALPALPAATLPERHLGLVMPGELGDLEARLDAAADLWDAEVGEVDVPPTPGSSASPVLSDASPPPHLQGALVGTRIAIARDDAFCFLYEENLGALRELGASLVFFSPLDADALPACDALYLPGGYPELHAPRLAEKRRLWRDVAAHVAAGRPLVAECGGLMVLGRTLVTLDGRRHEMGGVLDLEVQMEARIQAIGPQEATLPGIPDGPRLRGHTFHCSRASGDEPAAGWSRSPLGTAGEAIFQRQRLVASYVHWYLPSSLEATVQLFRRPS